jgi:hypothetical protein
VGWVKDYFDRYYKEKEKFPLVHDIPAYLHTLWENDWKMEHDIVKKEVADKINELCSIVHEANRKWWTDINTGEYPIKRNVGELLCLVHSEISEALEGHRKGLMDDKLPNRQMIEVELADTIIRIFDISAGLKLDLGGSFVEKMEYNRIREDHKIENRLKDNGKKY